MGGLTEILFEPESVRGDISKSREEKETAPPITQNGMRVSMFTQRAYDQYDNSELGSGLRASGGIYGGGSENLAVLYGNNQYIVRKLTPKECERLQGLPDDWTLLIPEGKRYRALGNGMSQPCADYVMSQVVKTIGENNGNRV